MAPKAAKAVVSEEDMDFGKVTGVVDNGEEEDWGALTERAWIDEDGNYRTPERWKDPYFMPTDPTDWGFGPAFRGPHYSERPKFPEGKRVAASPRRASRGAPRF